MMTEADLKVNRVYRAKRPRSVGVFNPVFNDRMIVWIGLDQVQYDSSTLRLGRRYPKTTIEKFLKWAAEDVTDQTPDGDWCPYKEKVK